MKTKTLILNIAITTILIGMTSCKKKEADTMEDHNQHTPAPVPLNINYPAAYVVNGTSNNISVIKLSDNTVAETISLNGSTFPHHIYLNPAKTKLAVAITSKDLSGGHVGHGGSLAGQKIQIIDVVTGNIDKEIGVAKLPHNAAYNVAGDELWIPQGDSVQGTVLVYKTSDWSLLNTINVGKLPSEVTFASNGSKVYVANTKDGSISVINPSTKAVMQTIAVGIMPVGAWPASNGKMYADNEGSQTVSEIDVTTNSVTATINLGFKPGYVAYNSLNAELWVTDATNGKVVYYTLVGSIWTNQGNITTGADAHAIAFSGDGSKAYITNQGANTVSVINVSNHTVTNTINVGSKPNGIILK
jgi:YVTN family beta-propeller protein